jgi:hypothetical protein
VNKDNFNRIAKPRFYLAATPLFALSCDIPTTNHPLNQEEPYMSFRQMRAVARYTLVTTLIISSIHDAGAENTLADALTKGKVDLYARLRYEFVDDNQGAVKDADAVTLRTALGYNTGLFHNFGLYLQLEDVRAINEDYNDGGTNGKIQYATVVDPEGTELQQANIRYEGIANTVFRLGRQEIEHRQAPLHRYVGNILWRQNWQTFDAFRATHNAMIDPWTGLPRLKLDYSYVWNVNRIFGEDNKIADRDDMRMNSHFLRAEYEGFMPLLKLEGYGYLLDFDESTVAATQRLTTNTFGIRAEGSKGLGKKLGVLYTGEFANQRDASDNPIDINANYYLGELGATWQVGHKYLGAVTVKGSYEVLEGDDFVPGLNRAFQTPLGTNHAFQGWADRFLVTPADGIRDFFITVRAGLYGGATVMFMYHDLSSDNDDYDYGVEYDVILEKPFAKHWLAGVKYSAYDADQNALNIARNSVSGQAFDINKFWTYIQFRF